MIMMERKKRGKRNGFTTTWFDRLKRWLPWNRAKAAEMSRKEIAARLKGYRKD